MADEVAYLRRALLTEKSLRVDVEEQNRRLRKTLFKLEQASRPTRFHCALRCVASAVSAAWQWCIRMKGMLADLIRLEDDVEPLDPEVVERSKKAR
jgi:hypothetical protein